MSIRVRMAPSPTGDPHLGFIRTALFDFLLYRQGGEGSSFILRIEDTDRNRLVEGSVEILLQALQWYGLEATEGVYLDERGERAERGQYGPYTQSERLDIYKEHVETLIQSGHAYRCFCTPDRLAKMRAEQESQHQPPKYDRHCLLLSQEEVEQKLAAGEKYVIRSKIQAGVTVQFSDLIRGEMSFQSDDLDDYVLMKSDGFPTYHLAVVVDDHLMKISHVLRGEEWLPSTPKHILLYKAFGWEPPIFAHVPVILGPDGKKKLSKRDGAGSVQYYMDAGYLPEVMLHFLVLLGWSPGAESPDRLSLEQMIGLFRLEKVQKAPAKFDLDRLNQLNGAYLRALSTEELAEKLLPWLRESGFDISDQAYLLRAVELIHERIKRLEEAVQLLGFFYAAPKVDASLLLAKKASREEMKEALSQALEFLSTVPDWSRDQLELTLRQFAIEKNIKPGVLFWGVRVALSGELASPGVFELLEFFGLSVSSERIEKALTAL